MKIIRFLFLLTICILFPSLCSAYDDPELNDMINREYDHCEVITHASYVSSPFVDELSMYNVCVGEILEKIHAHITTTRSKYPDAIYVVLGTDFTVAHKKDIAQVINRAITLQSKDFPAFHILGRDMCLYGQKNLHKGSCYRVLLK